MIRTICSLLAIVTVTSVVSAAPGTVPTPAEPQSDVFVAALESGPLQTFIMAGESAGLVDTLKGDGPFTVFVPSNEAFERLPSGEFHDLLKPENEEKLRKLSLGDVISGRVRMADLKKRNAVESVGGPALAVVPHFIAGVKIGTPRRMAHVQNKDVEASNGLLHIVDAVLTP